MEIFDELSLKIGQILYRKNSDNRNLISKLLDELNSLNYRYSIVNNHTKAILLINQCCTSIQPEDDILAPKSAQLITKLITTQNIIVEGKTLTLAIQWCLEGLNNPNINIVIEILWTLEAFLKNNTQNFISLLDPICKELTKKIENSKDDNSKKSEQVLYLCTKCLENLTVLPEEGNLADILNSHLEFCANLFISLLVAAKPQINSIPNIKMLESCLNGLHNIISLKSNIIKQELEILMGIIKCYMVFYLKNIEFVSPTKITPTTLNLPTQFKEDQMEKVRQQKKRNRETGKNKKKQKKSQETQNEDKYNGFMNSEYNSDQGIANVSMNSSGIKFSDSDFSDSELSLKGQTTHHCNKVRQAALNLFICILKCTDKATIFPYWSSFIPASSTSGNYNLISCILYDTSIRGRISALHTLLLFLSESKIYLRQAEMSGKTTSFTPFSEMMGLTLIELHKKLCLILGEISAAVLPSALKCIGALIQATPYNKINYKLIPKLIRNIKSFIFHKDIIVQVAALIDIGYILVIEPSRLEIQQAIINLPKEQRLVKKSAISSVELLNDSFDYAQFSSEDEDEEEEEETDVADSLSWLLRKCLKNLGVKIVDADELENISSSSSSREIGPLIKQETLQVISSMSRLYFDSLLEPHLNLVIKSLELALIDRNEDVSIHAGRCVMFLGEAMSKKLILKSYIDFWTSLLNGPLIAYIQNEENPILRGIGCDCLAVMGSSIFQDLSRDKQLLVVSLLFNAIKDEEKLVKGAAARALSFCVKFKPLNEDPGFIIDATEAILKILKEDQNNSVKAKASWALAAIIDYLSYNTTNDDDSQKFLLLQEILTPKYFLDILQECLKCSSKDTNRVRMSTLRAIGDLIFMLNEELCSEIRVKDAVKLVLDILLKATVQGSFMKARWNAGYALSRTLKNPILFKILDNDMSDWQSAAIPKLTELAASFENIKVRTQIIVALTAPTLRSHYGQFYFLIWTTLLESLENSVNIVDFSEYQHKDNLIQQICLGLGHLTSIVEKKDLGKLLEIIELHLEQFKHYMHKIVERLVPEKSSALVAAISRISELESSNCDYDTREKRIIAILKSIFIL